MGMDGSLKTCVVFYGRGIIGWFLVLCLLKQGNWIVRVTASAQSLQFDPLEDPSALLSGRATFCVVDLRDKAQVRKGSYHPLLSEAELRTTPGSVDWCSIGLGIHFIFMYQQYEEEMIGLVMVLFDSIEKSKRLLMRRNLPAPSMSVLGDHEASPEDEGITTAKAL